jgi:hypothetical protein
MAFSHLAVDLNERFMNKLLLSILAAVMPFIADAADKNTRCYEMRTYHAAPGKLEDLHNRFRRHSLRLFEKHAITSIGYWVPMDREGKPENKLIFLLSYPSREAREKSWKTFMDDPEWQAAFKASEANGPLVTKVENPYLAATDYSPEINPSVADEPRAFELRIYKTAPGKLDDLHARFRNHTLKLFGKHGMTQLGYWTPMDKTDGADDTLIYILAHKSREGAAASFRAFREDPDWIAARKASEEKAGGSLTVPDGVKSTFMTPTDYSPTK